MNIGSGSADSQDFELNLASLIDCFTVLITFMLVSASFISIGLLDAGIAAAGPTQAPTTPPAINITVELGHSENFVVRITGKETRNISVAAKDGHWDFDALTARLTEVKGQWKDINAATLSAENTVPYKDVVQSMEVVRKNLPVVLLGGF